MNKIIGLAIIAFGIFLEVMWLGVCFGSIIIGILLLIFAPGILFFPFNFFLVIGLSVISGQKYQRGRFKYNQSYGSYAGSSFSNPQALLDKYYELLESKKGDDLSVVKKNYRRLVKKYHYDSIASQDLSQSEIKAAEEKTQALNEAYAAIKESLKR